MSEKNSKKSGTYIIHSIELLVWLVVVLLIVAISSITFINREKNDTNDYQIFLPDVDGLIVGSPVRMMGIEVGHVIKIKPVKDEVYVKFVITNPEVYIPQGTKVTVEFSGMAGSKSLELYVPDKNTYKDKDTPLLTVNPPKRLHDALGLLGDMYHKLTSIIYSVSSFGDKIDKTNVKDTAKIKNVTDINGFLQYSDKFIDESINRTDEIRTNLKGFKKHEKIQ